MNRRIMVMLFCLAAMAQAKPDLGGAWNFNAAASDYGPAPNKPDKIAMTIVQAGPDIEMTQAITGPQGTFTAKFKYSTDGKEITNVNGPIELKSTAKWDGDTLAIESSGKVRGNDAKLIDKWTLSGDGKTLKLTRHVTVTQGEFDQTYVYDHQ